MKNHLKDLGIRVFVAKESKRRNSPILTQCHWLFDVFCLKLTISHQFQGWIGLEIANWKPQCSPNLGIELLHQRIQTCLGGEKLVGIGPMRKQFQQKSREEKPFRQLC